MKLLKPALFATFLAFPFQAFSQTACESYTVASGDTLRLIAERVYGSRDSSSIIFEANRGVVGGNPNSIEIGMQLNIPCGMAEPSVGAVISVVTGATTVIVESTELPNADSDASSASSLSTETPIIEPVVATAPITEEMADEAPQEPTAAAVIVVPSLSPETAEAEQVTVSIQLPEAAIFVSAGIFPPFTDGGGQGLMTNIVRASFVGNTLLETIEVNPVSLPFDPLRASNDPDVVLSFPWIDPGCDNQAFLSNRSKMLCDGFQFSDAAFEIVMTFFVADQGGLAQATEPQQFDGKNICVPEQYPVSHLAEAGFLGPNVTIERAKTVAECMSKLLSGLTDVVNADYLSVESTYAVLNSQSIIVENPSFTWVRSIHAIAANGNAAGLQALATFDDGLDRIMDSGEWATVVQEFVN